MAFVTLSVEKLRHNYQYLNNKFQKNNKEWSIVTKLLCGNESFLKEVLDLGIREVCDSRISNLKKIKKIKPDVQTVYIKPPASRSIASVVKYADVSFNSESETIRMLSEEAKRQRKTHKIVIMIELGDLREGIMGNNLIAFYKKIFKLPHIEVVALGANLTCLHGILPSQDKLIQLSLYKQLIEAVFHKKIPFITAGTSVTLPLLTKQQVPAAMNHFRIGETLYFGKNLMTGMTFSGMRADVFKLYAEIIEITRKPMVPVGEMSTNVSGETYQVNEDDYGKQSWRAILDLGLLDISPEHLVPEQENLQVIDASSDMLIIDLGSNQSNKKVGDLLSFNLTYMGALALFNSNYIDKIVTA